MKAILEAHKRANEVVELLGKCQFWSFEAQRQGVYTHVIKDAKSGTLMPIMRQKIVPDSVVYSDCFKAYNSLDNQGFRHLRIHHSKLLADQKNHINGIENFWNQAKRHVRKFNGVPKEHVELFLKECAWGFNNSDPKTQLTQLKPWVQGTLISLFRTAPYILIMKEMIIFL